MPYCAIWFADDRIREETTLAGNLINGSPAADGTPAVMTLNGEIEIARLEKGDVARRILKLEEFIEGPGKVALADGEIVTALICDALSGYGGAFEKVGQRRSLIISVACLACVMKLDPAGANFANVRLSLGGVGPVPLRLRDIEAFLSGKPVCAEAIRQAAQMIEGFIRSRSPQEYRKHVVEGFIERGLLNALSDCGVEVAGLDTRELDYA